MLKTQTSPSMIASKLAHYGGVEAVE